MSNNLMVTVCQEMLLLFRAVLKDNFLETVSVFVQLYLEKVNNLHNACK